jgi:hypothetical protein
VFDLRFSDLEDYRIPAVQKPMSKYGVNLKLQNGRTTQNNEVPWKTIDAAATINNNKAAVPDVAEKLYQAIKSYEEGGEAAKAHWAALVSAQRARVGSSCVGAV